MKHSQTLLRRGGERTLDIPEEGVGHVQAATLKADAITLHRYVSWA